MVSCLRQGSEMCNFRRVVLTRGVAAYTPLCTRVPRRSKLNKKQKQNRETKKKSKRYIRDSKVNRQGQPMDLFLKISILQARFYWLGDVEEIICPAKENVDGRKIIQGVSGDLMSEGLNFAVRSHLALYHPPSPQ